MCEIEGGREISDSHNSMAFSLNAMFLLLIPKKGVHCDVNFISISLLGSLYELLAKVLANGLKTVVDKVVCN